MEESYFEEKDIVNKEYYEGIKYMVNCSICLDIIRDPVQCTKCQHCFCWQCVKKLNSCPFKCGLTFFKSALLCKQLLSELIIKCECGKEMSFDFIKIHKEVDCEKIDIKERYKKLRKEYEMLRKEVIKDRLIKDDYSIISNLHPHTLVCNKHFLLEWNCDKCNKSFNNEAPSYNCTLCNYDLCYECAEKSIVKGTVLKKMKEYYNEQVLTEYSIWSSSHHHPLEYLHRMVTTWYCDNCKTENDKNTPSFHCTLCDFDLCYDCAEKSNNTQNSNNQQKKQ